MNATKCIIEHGHKYLIKDGNGGFKSVNPFETKSFAVVKGTDITIGWKFEDDGPVVTELYELTNEDNVMKVQTEYVNDIRFAFKNKSAGLTKYTRVRTTDDGTIVTDEGIGPWVTEEGVMEWRKGIEIPDGTYLMDRGAILVRDDCELYQDTEHAAWYSEPTIDGKCEPCRAKLLDLGTDIGGDRCIEVIQRSLSALKSYAESNNIKLWYDTGSDTIRAVKVPNGYNCTMYDHEYKDQIPWELMPVVGELSASTDPDSDWQMGLVKIPEVKEGEHADR